jgi:hypothetical protein
MDHKGFMRARLADHRHPVWNPSWWITSTHSSVDDDGDLAEEGSSSDSNGSLGWDRLFPQTGYDGHVPASVAKAKLHQAGLAEAEKLRRRSLEESWMAVPLSLLGLW